MSGFVGTFLRFLTAAGKANCPQSAEYGGLADAIRSVSFAKGFRFWGILLLVSLPLSSFATSDLVVYGSVTVSPGQVTSGNNLTVSLTIYNQGSTTASASTTRVQIKNAALTAIIADQDNSTPSIAPGYTVYQSYTVAIPAGTTPGSYNAYIVLDRYNTAGQGSNTGNDYGSSSSFNINAPSVIYTVNIASSNPSSSVLVYVGPTDVNGNSGGYTAFSRQFNSGTYVTLVASATAGGNNFSKWTLNGVDSYSSTLNFTINGNSTATAVYVTAPPVTHTLTVASSNPNSGVSITGYQLDNNNNAGGTTTFSRVFNQNSAVSFSAPTTSGGNTFQKWQKDGVDLTTSTTANITLDTDHSITAVYGQNLPNAQTAAATSITATSAQLNGTVSGNGLVGTAYWQYGTTTGYGNTTPPGDMGPTSASGSYTINGLTPNTLYHFSVVASTTAGTVGGGDLTFQTLQVSTQIPTVQTLNPSSVTANSATLNGQILSDGGSTILERRIEWAKFTGNWGTGTLGVDYGIFSDATTPFNVSGNNFSLSLNGFAPNTSYKYRVWAKNSTGWSDVTLVNTAIFNTLSQSAPSLTVTSPTGSTTWPAGTAQTIYWTVSGTPPSPISYFGMNYSLNGGTSWVPYGYFAPGSANSGSWSIPSTATSSQAIVQIIAVNSSGTSMFWNQSPAFTISSLTTGNPTSIPNCNNRSPSPASAVTINFNGSASTGSSPSCNIVSYLWTFDDGTSTNAEYPAHTFYPNTGNTTTYNVNLTVTDCGGKQASAILPIYITGLSLGNSNPTQPTSKDPVNLATGNYTYNHVDLRLPGRGLPFEFQRFYNSKATASTGLPLGYGWTDSYNIQLSVITNNAVVITFGDGHAEMYATNGAGGYFSQAGIYNVLTTSGGAYTLTTKEQQKYNFNSSGQLTSIVDKNNNAVSLAYTGNNLTTITNTVGRVISFAYNANNCLTNLTDPLGRTVRFAYDANTNLIIVTDTRGGLTRFGYDQYHQITNAIDPRGNTFVSMQYDNLQRVVSSQKDALQGATTFTYDFVAGKTTVVDAMTNVSYYYYDPQLRVKEIDDNLGHQQVFQYDANNNRTWVRDKNGAVTTYAYDGNGNVIAKTNAFTQPTTIAYDALNNPTNRLDALTGRTVFRYDPKGNLTNTFNSLGKTNSYQYDVFGEPVVVTDANGNTTTNTYDSFGNLILTRDALGGTNTFAYDAASRKLKSVDALGHTNLFFYDNADNLTNTVNALGKTSRFTFDSNNNRVTATDFNGNTTTSIYDVKDRLIITRDPLGNSVTNDYDALDRKIRVWDAMGGVTRFGYDANGNLLVVTNALNYVTRYAYDPNGNRTNIVDALGNSTTNLFDSLNRLVSTTDALGHTATSVHDALGRRIQGIDALNRTNFFAYDPMGRLTNFTDTAGGTVANTYDNVGNRLFSTDPNGHTTTNVFDALNRLSQTTDPVGGVAQFGYDLVGNLISRKDPNGNTTTFLYDANNRRTKITYPTGTPVTFAYDNNGNRTSMTDTLGTTTYSYDALNRLTSVTDGFSKTVSYGYDKNGNRTSITYPGGKTVTYAYDAANRLKSVTDWQYNTTTYNYDADGNLTGSVNPNGSTAVYQYDPANRLMTLTNTVNSTVISSYQYTLDAIGNHSQVSQTEQLPTIPVVGQSTYAYDNDSKQITLDGQTQVFDANGNLTSVNPTNLLAYDYENRLVQTSFTDATNTYQYDGAGNRMSANRSGVVTRYVLDRNSALAQVLAETDASGNVIYYYIYGLGLVSRIDAGGNAQFYHYDSRGSTIAMTDASGKITEAYAYDPFGRPINGYPSDNRFRYLGRHGVLDEENGLLYIRARYYSTKRGRFITKDPTTGKEGDSQSMNRYIYALNNPVRLIDISGMSAQEANGQKPTLATSDGSLFHNFLVSPSTHGLDTTVAGSTPQIQSGGSGIGERIISLGDVISTAGSTDTALNYFQASQLQRNLLNGTGKTDLGGLAGASTVISMAEYAVEATGGLSNIAAGWANAGSNIKWLFTGATTDEIFNFGIDASTKVTAVTINTIASPVFSAINFFTGQNISVTGNEVQSAVQSYVNFFQLP